MMISSKRIWSQGMGGQTWRLQARFQVPGRPVERLPQPDDGGFGGAFLVIPVYVHWAKPIAHPVPAGER
jgi:hypothetical protein